MLPLPPGRPGGYETGVTQTDAKPQDPRSAGIRASAPRVFLITAGIAVVMITAGLTHSLVQAGEFLVEALTGAVIGLATARWLVPYAWYRDRQWVSSVMIAAVITPPVTVLILGVRVFVDHETGSVQMLLEMTPQVFVTSLVMATLAMLIRPRPTETHAAPAGAPPAKFLARLPAKLAGAELYAVEAEDHYLRLHTSLGQDLILMRLADAVAELEGLEGAQTHRSWWVAKGAIASAERQDGRAVLTLKDGAEVPVSRGFARELRAAGWF